MPREDQPFIDAAQAAIIVDRCVPPSDLGIAASTLKAVLWCLRGLGAPGSELGVASGVVALRTCLSDRAVRKAIAVLRDRGILEQTSTPAPGRCARFMVNYLKLAEWLAADDRQQARIRTEPSPNNQPNTGTTCRRTPAPDAAEHRHHLPPSRSTPARGSATPARGAATPASGAADSKEGAALPAKTSSSSSAAAAAAITDRWSEWDLVGRRAGLEPGLAGQAAALLVQIGHDDANTARIALERLAERVKSGSVTNPVGLLKRILEQPGGPELSRQGVARLRAAELKARQLDEFLDRDVPEEVAELRRRVHVLATRTYGTTTADDLAHRAMADEELRSFVLEHWETLKAMRPATAGAA
jgi:hypothetical protein